MEIILNDYHKMVNAKKNGKDGVLESASAFAHRILEEIEALAGTTACKSVQLVRPRNYFIDTIIYPSDTGGYDSYRSLSPRFSH